MRLFSARKKQKKQKHRRRKGGKLKKERNKNKMKKILALVLAMIMVLSFAACGNNATEEPSGETEVTVGSALEILETVWGQFGEDEKFFSMGGDYDNMVDNAPGAVTNADFITGVLLVPADASSEIVEAASLVHAMNLNSFTCGAFKVADAAAFAETMHEAIASNQWMCGFPDKMVIATFGNEYVLAMFGINDAINPFEEKLVAAYPEATIVYSEAIA